MGVLSEDAIRELAQFRSGETPVTTCYLDVDGRRWLRHQDVERELELLLRRARHDATRDKSVLHDLSRIEDYVRAGVDRSSTRGLAIFSCAARDLWEVFALPVPVHSRVVVNDLPAVGQLEAVVHDYERIGLLLVDRQRVRMFVFDLDGLADQQELTNELPRGVDVRGEKDRGGVEHHVDALQQQHVRRVADLAWATYNAHGFQHLALGGADEIVTAVEAALHPYLVERLAGRVPLTTGAGLDDITAEARRVEIGIERRREADAVTRLRREVGGGHRGVSGLAPVLDVLAARRVERLLVSRGYAEAGWRCPACPRLGTVGRLCPTCGAEMHRVDDVVEEAVEEALSQSCRVEICAASADLDVLGRIGALLRY